MALAEATIPEFTLGDRLAKARDHAGLSQDQMAERFGKSRATISTWERDESQPRNMVDVVNKWAEITGVDPAWILGLRSRWSLLREVHSPDGQMELALDTSVHPPALAMAR